MTRGAERVSWGDDDESRTTDIPDAGSDSHELNPIVRLLAQDSLFSELDRAQLSELASQARLTVYPKGTRIVRQGDAGESLLLVGSGVVEAVLERAGGECVRLYTFQSGDHFGEMSLFDGQPRSATAIAVSDCEIIEIGRDAVMAKMTVPVIGKLLVEMASRVRRTDNTVTELTDKVYRAAFANVHAAVSVELDSIKTLYQRTEHLSEHALERAEFCAKEVMQNADATVARAQARLDKLWSTFKYWVTPLLVVISGGLSLVGVQSYRDLQAKRQEALGWHTEIRAMHARMDSASKALRVVGETMTALRSARSVASLDQRVDTPGDLRRAALGYEQAKAEIMLRYVMSPDGEPRYEAFEPDVVFEAVDTYVSLVVQGRPTAGFAARELERRQLLAALLYVVKDLADAAESVTERRAHGLADTKLRDTFYLLADDAPVRVRKQAVSALAEIVLRPGAARGRENAALILASLGEKSAESAALLLAMTKRSELAAAAALALAKVHDRSAWGLISKQLAGEQPNYEFAAQLAREGGPALRRLAVSFGEGNRFEQLQARIQLALRIHEPRNCYELRYDRWLGACLLGQCGKSADGGPIGGDCAL